MLNFSIPLLIIANGSILSGSHPAQPNLPQMYIEKDSSLIQANLFQNSILKGLCTFS